MLFKHAARGDERAFITVQGVEASSLTLGYLVAVRVGTNASFDGTQAVLADSGNAVDLPGFLGVAAQDIVANGFGIIQNLGPAASVWISNVGTSLTINVGDALVPGALAGGGFSAAPTYANAGFRFVIASNVAPAVSATAYVSGYVRCF